MVIKRQESLCVVGGCGAKTRARSLCGKHYQEARSKGWRLPELRKATIEDRLLHGSTEDPATGCWIWSMATDSVGYGMVTVATGKSRSAHREAYKCFVGEIPSNTVVCHKCDTPACINPKHLFLGTQGDNMRDASRKGRISSALTLEQVKEVRESKESVRAIAERLGVGLHVIYKCRRGDTYPKDDALTGVDPDAPIPYELTDAGRELLGGKS